MYSYEYPHPAVTTDAIVFRFAQGLVELLLIQRGQDPYRGRWALPGGFVDIDEDLEPAVRRELAEETGIESPYLEQFRAYGTPGRDPRERVITITYLGVVAAGTGAPLAASDAAAAGWFDLRTLPPLAFDHDRIIAEARERLAELAGDPTFAARFAPDAADTDTLAAIRSAILAASRGGQHS